MVTDSVVAELTVSQETDSWGIVNLHYTLSFATIILKNNRGQSKLSKDAGCELLDITVSEIQTPVFLNTHSWHSPTRDTHLVLIVMSGLCDPT